MPQPTQPRYDPQDSACDRRQPPGRDANSRDAIARSGFTMQRRSRAQIDASSSADLHSSVDVVLVPRVHEPAPQQIDLDGQRSEQFLEIELLRGSLRPRVVAGFIERLDEHERFKRRPSVVERVNLEAWQHVGSGSSRVVAHGAEPCAIGVRDQACIGRSLLTWYRREPPLCRQLPNSMQRQPSAITASPTSSPVTLLRRLWMLSL